MQIIFISLFLLFSSPGISIAEEILSWEDCIKEAAKNHPDLISAKEVLKQSQANKEITKSSALPQVGASVSASSSKKSTAEGTDETYSYGVTATQLLFDGFKAQDDIKAASEDLQAARYGFQYASSQVRKELRAAFINLLKAQELSVITEEIYKIRKSNLDLITLRYESGVEHKGALLKARANLAQAQLEIDENKRNINSAQRELSSHLGRTESSRLKVNGSLGVKFAKEESPDFDKLAQAHPNLAKYVSQRNSAVFSLKSAKAGFIPELNAHGGASRSSSEWPPEGEAWNAGLTLSVPIFEGGLKTAQLRKAEAVYNQAVADEKSVRNSVAVSIEKAWGELISAVDSVDIERQFLDAAEERAKISEEQYSLGLIQFDNWTIIEDDLVRAKKAFLDAQINALVSEANWIQAKGETLEYAQN
ncbi:MAG: TolC family protein [Candidatus Omnitrophica bacterium]|nr:TolC family protein [Candidatus Omnitrophota bacterium]